MRMKKDMLRCKSKLFDDDDDDDDDVSEVFFLGKVNGYGLDVGILLPRSPFPCVCLSLDPTDLFAVILCAVLVKSII